METFIANLDEINLERLERASRQTRIAYRKRTLMTAYSNKTPDISFFSIFCEDKYKGTDLFKEYVRIALSEDKIDELDRDYVLEGSGIQA